MILRIEQLGKSFRQGGREIQVLDNLCLELSKGETLAVQGPSGSGKSTFLSLLAGIDRPDRGKIHFSKEDLGQLSEEELTRLRGRHIGMIFQQFHLLPHLSALENITVVLEIAGQNDAQNRGRQLLAQVGLSHRAEHLPHQLSGGERQRVAIARSMATGPQLLLADEPGGSLDRKIASEVMELLFGLVRDEGMAMILVTHNPDLAQLCDRVFEMKDGKLHIV